MKIHHLGYLVQNIDESLIEFERLGFEKISDKVIDAERMVLIQFIKSDNYVIELIEPESSDSPVAALLKKNGEMPYHICYLVDDIAQEVDNLLNSGYILIEKPGAAVAMENKKVAFLYKKGVGIIELVEG